MYNYLHLHLHLHLHFKLMIIDVLLNFIEIKAILAPKVLARSWHRFMMFDRLK
jgi:hypothetical protein